MVQGRAGQDDDVECRVKSGVRIGGHQLDQRLDRRVVVLLGLELQGICPVHRLMHASHVLHFEVVLERGALREDRIVRRKHRRLTENEQAFGRSSQTASSKACTTRTTSVATVLANALVGIGRGVPASHAAKACEALYLHNQANNMG